MIGNPNEKNTLFCKGPSISKRELFRKGPSRSKRELFKKKRGYFSHSQKKFVWIGESQHTLNTVDCDDSSIASLEDSPIVEGENSAERSKFILVVDNLLEIENEEEQVSAKAQDTKKQSLLSEFLHDVKAAESALWFLWKFPEYKTQDPNTYLQASTEVISLTLALSWTLTMIFNPSIIDNNPFHDRLDYNHVSVGWNTFPANIVGVVGISSVVHIALRFVHLDESRTRLLGDNVSERLKTFGLISSKVFALAMSMMPIIFAVPPTISVYGHSLPFLFFIVTIAAVMLGRFAMFQDELSQIKKIYIGIFSILSFIYPAVLLYEYRYYDMYGKKSPWPGMLTMMIDYSWFALLSLMPSMLPKDAVLQRDYKLGFGPKQL
ncbi:hypothetical protein CTEN210_03679 [Chaetoceros tenuissimus]|uniref:Uncharacterized protein n=1 Tax=Chaetoceros tenuissimus TaxID=426638 RepID=A0AAD3CM02_9STRA|nr:hypothetical protein CTEN210_03679 [Chaetoceros tenuissimus]